MRQATIKNIGKHGRPDHLDHHANRCSTAMMTGLLLVIALLLPQPTSAFVVSRSSMSRNGGASSPIILHGDKSSSSSRDFLKSRPTGRNVTSSTSLYVSTSTDSILRGDASFPSSSSSSTAASPSAADQARFRSAATTDLVQQRKQQQKVKINDGSTTTAETASFLDGILSGFWGPRIVLGAIACFYATNFPQIQTNWPKRASSTSLYVSTSTDSILRGDASFPSSSSSSSSTASPSAADQARFRSAATTDLVQQRKQQQRVKINDGSTTAATTTAKDASSFLDGILSGFWGPRIVLGAIACFYATNFPLGTIMADAMPSPAAVTSARMVLAAMVMSPFIRNLDPSLRLPAIFTGCCTAIGYITQSMALVDTNPATVSFLGSATVLVCPFLSWAIDKKPMSWKDAPQTWMAAILCLMGVACLELIGAGSESSGGLFHGGAGDGLALLQAVGFGTQVYLSERMVADKPDQALPVTATLIATAAFLSGIWCVADGWMWTMPAIEWQSYALPGLFFAAPDTPLHMAAMAILWTGFVSTALSFFVEMNALSRVPSSQAAVILATEPMWAALFAAGLLGETFGTKDVVGGVLMVGACIVSGMKAQDVHKLFSRDHDGVVGEAEQELEMKCCYRWDDEESQKRKEKENNSMRIPPPNETNPTDNRNRTHMNASTKNIYDEEQDNNT
eukprot:CAMPEP_0119570220 /NCGR_PEP_ID=MMETSP1352-20130426/43500_1 /TAXON_ID=265584 /ORGANISM="Stauroneis constricta, Strain CCMP1120" /LENGTH=679 /DNA_ID=CAMNT_0007619887 /DNA_START=114 /DNA_END=2150 /DNA_ORIENTATION=-